MIQLQPGHAWCFIATQLPRVCSRIYSATGADVAEPGRSMETLQAAGWLALRERLRAVRRHAYLRILHKYVGE